jgi:hypothetical protein
MLFSIASVRATTYPFPFMEPAGPTTSDSIFFWIVKGKSLDGQGCCLPQYVTYVRFMQGSGVAGTIIVVKYQQVFLGCACLPGTDSAEYGPDFSFGRLPAGTYAIYDSTAMAYVYNFSVSMPGKDTVFVTPESPTYKDSLGFSLWCDTLSCGGTGHDDTVLIVQDTCIYLSFSYEECTGCECFAKGATINFKRGPLAAGVYSIYKVLNPYCPPGMLCPFVKIMPELVGQVTVRGRSLSARYAESRLQAGRVIATFGNGMIKARFPEPLSGELVVSIFNVAGSCVRITPLSSNFLGEYSAEIAGGKSGLGPGTYFAQLRLNGKTAAFLKILLLR